MRSRDTFSSSKVDEKVEELGMNKNNRASTEVASSPPINSSNLTFDGRIGQFGFFIVEDSTNIDNRLQNTDVTKLDGKVQPTAKRANKSGKVIVCRPFSSIHETELTVKKLNKLLSKGECDDMRD